MEEFGYQVSDLLYSAINQSLITTLTDTRISPESFPAHRTSDCVVKTARVVGQILTKTCVLRATTSIGPDIR